MKATKTWHGVLFASGSLVVTVLACASGGTTAGSSTSERGAPAAFLSGTYNAVSPGPIAQITFYLGNHYQLVDGTCANALLGATAAGSAAPSLAGCNELGTYAVNTAGTTLTLSPVSGAARVLPFDAVLAGLSYGTTSESFHAGGGLHLLGSGSGYYSSGDAGGGYYGEDAAAGDAGTGYYGEDAAAGDAGTGYYSEDAAAGDAGAGNEDASTGDAGSGDAAEDSSVGEDGGDASVASDGGDASASDGGDASADDGGDASDAQPAAVSCPGGTPAQGGTPLAHAFVVGQQSLVGGGAPSGTPDPSQGGQWSCSGSFDQTISNAYYLTSFGCSSSSPAFQDPSDNCCGAGAQIAAAAGLCGNLQPASNCSNSCASSNSCNSWRSKQSGSIAASFQCEEMVNYYSTGAVVYGLGTRLCLSTPAGKGLVVFVYDDGPSCTIERKVSAHVLDVSPPTAEYLFGESQISATERKAVFVTQVGASTPLGPDDGCGSSAQSSGRDAGTSDAGSTTGSGADNASDAGCVSCSSCASDSDCNPGGPLGLVCNSGACQPGCHSSAQCAGGMACVSGACQGTGSGQSCSNDGACNPGGNGAGMICSGGVCVSGCHASWQCPGNTTCKGGQCS